MKESFEKKGGRGPV